MSRVLPAFWSYGKDQVWLARHRAACVLYPKWYDRFAELNRLRAENKALLARIKGMSERSEDRDFGDAFERLLAPTNEHWADDGPPSRWSVASDIMDGSR